MQLAFNGPAIIGDQTQAEKRIIATDRLRH